MASEWQGLGPALLHFTAKAVLDMVLTLDSANAMHCMASVCNSHLLMIRLKKGVCSCAETS